MTLIIFSLDSNSFVSTAITGRGWGEGGRAQLLTCPYPLKVQARPPRDQRLAIRSRDSGQGEDDERENLEFWETA